MTFGYGVSAFSAKHGNNRVGRLVTFKKCLAASILAFIIANNPKMFYDCRQRVYLNRNINNFSITDHFLLSRVPISVNYFIFV